MKWLWYRIYYNLGGYISYYIRYISLGLTKKMKEDMEYLDCFEQIDDMYLYMCLSEFSDNKYFILYNKKPSRLNPFPKMIRVNMIKPEYIPIKKCFTKRWVLTENEKQRLCNLLNSKPTTCTKYNTVWEVINEEANLQSLNLGWNHESGISIPPMPDYMKLPE